jgi:hypothetical protein
MWPFLFNLGLIRLLDVAGSEAGGGAAGTPAPASTTSQPAASTPAAGGTPSPSPSGTQQADQPTTTTQPADDLQDGNWRELRSRYDSQKTEIAALKAQANPQAAAVVTHAQSIAKTLGYTDADFNEAFLADPVKTLEILTSEQAAKAQPGAQSVDQGQSTDLTRQIEDAVNQRLTPIQEFQNRQQTEVAMQKYETTLGDAIKADPILSTAPPEIVEIVKDYLGEYFSTQPQILLAMKTKGDFTAVADALKFTAGRLHSGFKAWLAQTNPQSTTGTTPAARTGGKLTLDQIINDPGVLGAQYRE